MKERVFQTYQDAYKYTRWYPMNEYNIYYNNGKYYVGFDVATDEYETNLERKARERNERINSILGEND